MRVRQPGISGRRVRAIVRHVLRREKAPGVDVSVALIGSPAIRRLNRRFLGKDRVTDVLAFSLDTGGGRGSLTPGLRSLALGEVVVSVDRARVQAKQAGHPLRTELALLIVHGMLHLLGHDDRTAEEADRMMRRARALLADVGEQVHV